MKKEDMEKALNEIRKSLTLQVISNTLTGKLLDNLNERIKLLEDKVAVTSTEETETTTLTKEDVKRAVETLSKGEVISPYKEPEEKKEENEDIKNFNDLMKKIVNENKGKKTVKKTTDIEKLVELIENYKGSLSVMNNVKEMLKEKKTKPEKTKVIINFVKSVL